MELYNIMLRVDSCTLQYICRSVSHHWKLTTESALKSIQHRGGYSKRDYIDYVCTNGYLAIAELLHKDNNIYNHIAICYAVRGNHANILQFVHSKGVILHRNLFVLAVHCGSIDVLEWLKANNLMISEDTCTYRDSKNHRGIIGGSLPYRYCKKPRCSCKGASIKCAAEYGQLGTLRWLEANGFTKYVKDILIQSAKHGHLDIFKAYVDGKGLDEYVKIATVNGHLDVLAYLHEEWNMKLAEKLYVTVAKRCRNNPVSILNYLYMQGVPIHDDALSAAVCHQDMNTMQWLVDHDAEFDLYDCDCAMDTYTDEEQEEILAILQQSKWWSRENA